MLGDPNGFIFTDPHGDAMSFNALGVPLVAYEYATSHGIPKQRMYRVAIVPTSDPAWDARTTASGAYRYSSTGASKSDQDDHGFSIGRFKGMTPAHGIYGGPNGGRNEKSSRLRDSCRLHRARRRDGMNHIRDAVHDYPVAVRGTALRRRKPFLLDVCVVRKPGRGQPAKAKVGQSRPTRRRRPR